MPIRSEREREGVFLHQTLAAGILPDMRCREGEGGREDGCSNPLCIWEMRLIQPKYLSDYS